MEGIEVVQVEAKIVETKPGDLIVLKHPGVISDEAFERMKQELQPHFPGCKIILLEEGMDLDVYRYGS